MPWICYFNIRPIFLQNIFSGVGLVLSLSRSNRRHIFTFSFSMKSLQYNIHVWLVPVQLVWNYKLCQHIKKLQFSDSFFWFWFIWWWSSFTNWIINHISYEFKFMSVGSWYDSRCRDIVLLWQYVYICSAQFAPINRGLFLQLSPSQRSLYWNIFIWLLCPLNNTKGIITNIK